MAPEDRIHHINVASVRDPGEFTLSNGGDVVSLGILRLTLGLFGQRERQFLDRLEARARQS